MPFKKCLNLSILTMNVITLIPHKRRSRRQKALLIRALNMSHSKLFLLSTRRRMKMTEKMMKRSQRFKGKLHGTK